MDEIRIKKIELGMAELKRRLTDHDDDFKKDRKDIAMLQEILSNTIATMQNTSKANDYLEKITDFLEKIEDWAKKTYEVFHPIAVFMKKASVVLIPITILYHFAKWAWAKLVLFT